jgi:hypothetical protein
MTLDRSLHVTLALVLGLSLVASVPTQAQETESEGTASPPQPTDPGGGGFFAVGVHAADLTSLNDRLQQTGYTTFPSEMVAVGGGGYGLVSGRMMLGGEGYGLLLPSREGQGRTVSVEGGYGLFTLGYPFRPARGLQIHPLVGIGGGGLSLDIGSAEADQFEDVLKDPNRSASLTKASVLMSVGAGLEYRFQNRETGGLQIGLRGGYLLSPYNTDWSISGRPLSDGPEASLQGPFLRVFLGGWDTERHGP